MGADQPALYADRVVVITGARRGLGKVIAGHFLRNGAHVIGLARGESTIDHPRYEHHTTDIADDAGVRAAFSAIGRRHGRVDIAVSNAAVLTSTHALLMPLADARAMLDTNVMGTFLFARAAAKLMRKSTGGRFINIGSMALALEPIGDSLYAATKAACVAFTNVLAKELGAFRITCNTLGVTAFESDMLQQLPRHKVDAIIQALPIPRYATEDDICNVLDFFASERSSAITAQTVFLGGIHT